MLSFGKLLLLVVVVLTAVSAKKESKEDSAVVVLTKDNFDETIKTNELVMVEFYAPWCGHCKKLAPEYEKAAKAMESKGVVIAKVDATEETELGNRYGVQGYPTLKVFRSGEPSDYSGERSAAGIVKYLTNQVGPAVTVLASADELNAFIPSNEDEPPVVVAFTEETSKVGLFFASYAKQNRDSFRFGVAPSSTAAGKNVKEGAIVLFKAYDDLQNVYDGPLDKTDLTDFLKKNSFKSVDEIGPSNYQGYVERGLPISWLFLGDDEETNNAAKDAYRQVASNYKESLSLVYLSGTKYKQMAEKMALMSGKFPALAIENKDGQHFVHGDISGKPFTAEALEQFFADFTAGKILPTTRSQPIPAQPLEENVYIIVGDNFNDVVLDKNKDVLIEFYAPWCGHCKQLAPTYAKVATQLKDIKSVVIAKSDATANDYPPEFKVTGFPTLMLVQANSNKVIPFNGDRTQQGIVDFLKKNCAISFEVPEGGGAAAAAATDKDEL